MIFAGLPVATPMMLSISDIIASITITIQAQPLAVVAG